MTNIQVTIDRDQASALINRVSTSLKVDDSEAIKSSALAFMNYMTNAILSSTIDQGRNGDNHPTTSSTLQALHEWAGEAARQLQDEIPGDHGDLLHDYAIIRERLARLGWY